MKVVVTGASGNIGTALLRLAADEDWRVVGVARRHPDGDRTPYSSAEWLECDIGGADAVEVLTEAFTGADAVVHLAWAIQPRSGEPDMDRTNVIGSSNVLRAAAAAGVDQFVGLSSVAAYSPAQRWSPVAEDWVRRGIPGSAYSAGKALFECLLDGYADRNPGVALARLRPCAVVQRDAGAQIDSWTLSPLVPRRLLGRRWVPVPLWKDLRMQVVHADDVAEAIRQVLVRRASGAFNLAADPVLPARQLAAVLGGFLLPLPRRLLVGLAWLAWRAGLQPLHPGWMRLADQAPLLDTGRARRELGWRPRYDAVAALADLVAGMRDRAGMPSVPLRPAVDHGGGRWRRWPRLGRPSHQSQSGRRTVADVDQPPAEVADSLPGTAGAGGEDAR